jgi:plasmid replication initiation protein
MIKSSVSRSKKEEKSGIITVLPYTIENLIEMKKKSFIQSNQLVEAIFIQPFKEFELKVLCLISKYINENKYVEEVKTLEDAIETYMKVTIRKEDFCKMLNISPLNFYKQMYRLADELTKKRIKIKNSKSHNFDVMVLFPRVNVKNGNASFYMSYLLNPYLQHLKNNFSVSNLEYITSMGSAYAIRMYQLLNQYRKIGKRTFEMNNLRHLLGIQNEYLENFKNFNRDVIVVSKKHINASTDLQISCKLLKEGRIVKAIEFKIEEKENQFQKAIKQFQNETDAILSSALYRKSLSHESNCTLFEKIWNENNKDVTDDTISKVFEIWKKKRLHSYNASSFEDLSLLAKGEDTISDWYAIGVRTISSTVENSITL